jgi:hypothetical protein
MDQFKMWSVPKASLLPATLLGMLVLFTYSTLQNYGPESTLRKFHTAIKNIRQAESNMKAISNSDWNDLRTTLAEDIGEMNGLHDSQAITVFQKVNEIFPQGSTYSLARMDRHTREVRIAVIYEKKPLPPALMIWIVEKPLGGREWKISAHKTLSAMPVP